MANKLSTELLMEIFRHAEKGDLKSIRLASKAFSAISSRFLFDRVYISIHLKDLEILSDISRHPVLRLLVREAIYSGIFFNTFASSIMDSYYQDRLHEQNYTSRTGEDLAIICAALARMPNIKHVILTDHWYRPRDFFSLRSISFLFSKPQGGSPLSRIYPEDAKRPGGRPLSVENYSGDCFYKDHGFTVMSRALSITNTKISALSIDYIGDSTEGLTIASFHMAPRDLVHSCNAFRSLREIKFSLSINKGTGEVWNTREEALMMGLGNIPLVLAAAQDLEDLSFDFRGLYSRAIPLEAILGTQKWHRLRSISFFSHILHETDLRTIFERHLDTLRSIRLVRIQLKTGGWRDIAEWMRSYMKLERVSLHHLDERVDSSHLRTIVTTNLEKYVLHGELGELYHQTLIWNSNN
jgi:hypothetical protein